MSEELPGEVFIDRKGIQIGENFESVITARVAVCDILLVIIGKDWVTASDAKGRRLGRSDDLVSYEIVSAMRRQKAVLPVLVNDATMPRENDLPEALNKFSFTKHNAHTIDPWNFNTSANLLLGRIKKLLEETDRARSATRSQARSAPPGRGGALCW